MHRRPGGSGGWWFGCRGRRWWPRRPEWCSRARLLLRLGRRAGRVLAELALERFQWCAAWARLAVHADDAELPDDEEQQRRLRR